MPLLSNPNPVSESVVGNGVHSYSASAGRIAVSSPLVAVRYRARASRTRATPSAPVAAAFVVPPRRTVTPGRGAPVRRSVAHATSSAGVANASTATVVACAHVIVGRFCQYSGDCGENWRVGDTTTTTWPV